MNTGGMIALIPDNPGRFTVPGGEPQEEIHLTLAYLGDRPDGWAPQIAEELQKWMKDAARGRGPIQGEVFGRAEWNPGEDVAVVYQVKAGPDLLDLRMWANDAGRTVIGDALYPQQHEPFLPHITAGYGVDLNSLQPGGRVTLSTIRLALGDRTWDYPLMGENIMAAEDQPMAAASGVNKVPVTLPVMAVEGLKTSDGRYIKPGALGHRALPQHIFAQTQNPVGGEGHDGAYVVGQLETMERVPGPDVISRETGEPFPDGTFVWRGAGWVNPNVQGADLVVGSFNEETGQWEGGVLVGNSIDLGEVEAEYDYDDSGTPVGVNVLSAKIIATTLCAKPAFADAYVTVDQTDMADAVNRPEIPETLAASVLPAFRSADLGDVMCTPCREESDGFTVTQEKRDKAEKSGHAMKGGRYPIANAEDLGNAIQAVGRAGGKGGTSKDRDAVRRHIIAQAKRLGLESKIPDTWKSDGTLTASAAVTYPPESAFTDPQLPEFTPITLRDDTLPGDLIEVVGHLGGWNTCHNGFAERCRMIPRSKSGYAYFRTGAARAVGEDGPVDVPVGHITMGGGHAPLKMSWQQTAAFYDDVDTVIADVGAGEDEHGVWVHGIIRRGTPPEKIEALRASPLSGDWRPIRGSGSELIAAHAVNSPGFTVQRSLTASAAEEEQPSVRVLVVAGEVGALVAAAPGRTLQDGSPAPTGIVMVDYEQLGAGVALRLSGQVPVIEVPEPGAAEVLDYDKLANIIAAYLQGKMPLPGSQQPADGSVAAAGAQTLTEEFAELYADVGAEQLALAFCAAEADALGVTEEVYAYFGGEEEFKRRNWVSRVGGLPKYIKRISRHLRAKGMTESHAIATAVNAAKKMCSNAADALNFPGAQQVNPGSKAEACAAVASWERKKAQA